MRSLSALLGVLALTLAAPALAGGNPVVVELFTSQGCSSCPPADKLMGKLAKKKNLIVLSLHVDYWDYIGWKDRFADPAYTARQKAYAHAAGRNMIYTPQMIVNGHDDVVGARSMELADLIAQNSARPSLASVEATRKDGQLRVAVLPEANGPEGPFVIHLVRYTPERTVKITRGENAGRTLTYYHVVDGWREIGEWDGQGPMTVTATVDGDRPGVILVQAPGPGDIVAATGFD